MNFQLTPKDALRFIDEANQAGLPHSFVETRSSFVESRESGACVPASKCFLWESDFQGPELAIILRPDGTWTAQLCQVRSPGVDSIQGYDHGPIPV